MIRVLHHADRKDWGDILSDIDSCDVFFSPDYLQVNETILGGEAECFVYRDGELLVVYSYLRRPIPGSTFFDITSPYGYGGYVARPNSTSTERFRAAFGAYCREMGIVSEFIRFHPLYKNHLLVEDGLLQTTYHQPVVLVDYDQQNPSFKERVNKDALKKIRKAEQNQVRVMEDANWQYYQAFMEMYEHTMAVKRASAFYFFGQGFFESLRMLLNDRSLLFVALYEGQMIGGLLILYSQEYAYNYLSCSDLRYTRLGTNDLLQFHALDWAYGKGLRTYLLGGGMGGEDSLFHFKAKYSPHTEGFFIGRCIHLPEVYAELCQEKIERENSRLEEFFSRSWFPLYRSEPLGHEESAHDG